jgi:peptidyl-prolyl cis-trans isomerase C
MATTLGQAASIGPHKIDKSKVVQAVSECSLHAPELMVKQCLDLFWVPRLLLEAEAKESKLRATPSIERVESQLLYRALDKRLRQSAAAPSDFEVENYLKQHSRDLEKPLRIRLFRILLDSEKEAETMIAALGADATLEDFRKLARKSSVDHATHERGGDLGFVWPDGSTDLPQVRADAALYLAAQALKDGEIAKSPIPEGERFAVLWRRGSKAPVQASPEARQLIVQRIEEQKHEAQLQELLTNLKKKHVSARNDLLLGKLRRPDAALFVEP